MDFTAAALVSLLAFGFTLAQWRSNRGRVRVDDSYNGNHVSVRITNASPAEISVDSIHFVTAKQRHFRVPKAFLQGRNVLVPTLEQPDIAGLPALPATIGGYAGKA